MNRFSTTPFFPMVLISLVLLFVFSFVLSGCSSTPTQTQETTAMVVINAAVGVTVQKGTSDQSIWAERATRIVSVAKQLQGLNSDDISTLPALSAALAPLIDKLDLPPPDRIAANLLVASLSQIVDQQKDKINSDTKVAIQFALQTTIDAASVYIPANR